MFYNIKCLFHTIVDCIVDKFIELLSCVICFEVSKCLSLAMACAVEQGLPLGTMRTS